MARYAITILTIAAIIFAATDSADAASPIAEIVSPASPVDANMLERLEFTIRGTDPNNDLLCCGLRVDGTSKGKAYFESPTSGSIAKWTYAFGTPGTHIVSATPYDLAENYGDSVTWTVEVRNVRDSLELNVLSYNTHLFEESIMECICRCGDWPPLYQECDWSDYSYDDWTRRDEIVSRIAESGADIVALQEVWAPCWQRLFIEDEDLAATYPHSYNRDSSYPCEDAIKAVEGLWQCLYNPVLPMIAVHCCGEECCAQPETLGNGLVLLSKFPLGDIGFERFPTFEQCGIGDYETWSDKGVLTATVNAGGPIRIGISHALTGPDDKRSKWDTNYIGTAITPFQLNGETYIFALKDDDTGHIVRMEDYGRWWDEKEPKYNYGAGWKHLWQGPWGSDYDVVRSFELDDHPYLFRLSNDANHAYIYRINDDPSTGWTSMCDYDWYSPDVVAVESFELDGHPYLFALHDTNTAYIHRINDDPCMGWTTISEGSMSSGYVAVTSFELDGHPYLFLLDANEQEQIIRINEDPNTGWEEVYRDTFNSDYFHALTSFELDCHPYLFCLWILPITPEISNNVGSIYRINDDPSTGYTREYQSSYWWDEGEHNTDVDYISLKSFEMNGHPYLFALRNCCDQYLDSPGCRPRPGEAYLKRINDDPNTGWENLYQLEDMKIIRDRTVVDEDGPPAIMMGDFNIHRGKYGIMDRLFRKSGAVDAYIEVHGTGEGGETINWLENTLMQYFCARNEDCDPADPDLVDRIDYVYVKQFGSGRRLVPTDAYVIRDWKYGDDEDLSDHYPLAVKFKLFEGGCTARAKGDLNCDRLINFADLAILSSVWMSGPNDISWDGACDMSDPPDDIIDMKDIDAFAKAWLTMPPVHNVTRNTWYTFIQAAIDDADTGDEIEAGPGTYYEAINFKGKAIRLYSSGGPEVTTIDANGAYHVVKCVNGEDANTIIEGFTITGGKADGGWPDNYGGGIYNQGSSPTVTNCIFTGNSATFGAGMYNNNTSNPTVTDCNFTGNSAKSGGGGMYNYQNSNPTVSNCIFTGNTASPGTYGGGGMYNDQSSPTVTNCTFSGNSAGTDGGAMDNRAGSEPNLTNCIFSNNSATGNGGGMENYDSNPTLTNCTFTGNTANYGGGMCNYNSSPPMTNCNFNGNKATDNGGGMHNDQSSPTVTNCIFSGNEATNDGGGMYNKWGSSTVIGCTFVGNTASEGGGIYNGSVSSLTVTDCIFSDNEATSDGGGIYVFGGEPRLTNCIFSGNSADNGGGMYRWNPAYLTDCTFLDNTASYGGGMYNYEEYPCWLTNCTFSGNTVTHNGGGIYNTDSSPIVTDCNFSGNHADVHGGGMCNVSNSSPTVTNCVLSSNESVGFGGGMINSVSSNPTMTNCTFSGNIADEGGGMWNGSSNPTVTNCILWADTPNEISNNYSNPTVTYSDVQGGYGGTGNINADPCFVDAYNPDPNLWNLRLKPDSPCIDTGNTAALPPDTADLDDDEDTTEPIPFDLDGNNRVWNGIVDMGAYEYLTPSPPISSADNFKYLAMICANWLAGTEPEL